MKNFITPMLTAVILLALLAHNPGYAQSTDPLVQASLARISEPGDALERQEAEKIKRYIKAAERGDKVAQYELGLAFDWFSTFDDEEISFQWLLRSAEQGYMQAQEEVAGHPALEDPGLKRMFFWYQKAAEQGSARAMLGLASLYQGRGSIPENPQAARELYQTVISRKKDDRYHYEAVQGLAELNKRYSSTGAGR